MPFTLDHLIRLYRPRLFQGGLIKLQRRATKALFSSIDEDRDRGWMGRFVRVRTSDLIPTEKMPFPEEWNMKRKCDPAVTSILFFHFFSQRHSSFCDVAVPWMPGAVLDLKNWVRALVSTFTYAERSCRDLSKGGGRPRIMVWAKMQF